MTNTRFRRISLVQLLLVVGLCAGGSSQKFHSTTELITLYVTVTDDLHRLVPNLVSTDFEIIDDGIRKEPEFFTARVSPISTVIALDCSASMAFTAPLMTEAAGAFVLRMLPRDRAALAFFGGEVSFYPRDGFEADRERLLGSLREVSTGGETRLYDALGESIHRLGVTLQRRVLVVLTDGVDNGSEVSFDKVVTLARQTQTMIYAVGLQTDYFDGFRRVTSRPDRRIAELAKATGGGFDRVTDSLQLPDVFERIAEEIHSQYAVGFYPTGVRNDLRAVEVRVKRSGLSVRTQTHYVVRQPGTRRRDDP